MDNAGNNKTSMGEIGLEFGFDWEKRWVRCVGHVVNIVVKQMLCGKNPDAFEKEVFEGLHMAAKEHQVWRRRGSVGKWHNFAVLKLNEYYEHLNDSPLIYGAVILHPAYWWALFDDFWGDDGERQLWITKAKEMVQDFLEREYRDLEVDDPEIELPANKRLKTSRKKLTAWRTKKR
ncbi:hypothetical protein BFJ69_g14633 [Fusarium oxysporum]|uniref:Uncharacterized protein n=1 Tax=Fusarium oxysporum TaxID=5507 RepID=A0A420MH31_FUSOX|nr:hypothetical protein BFJ69_g14633 [Fusarium oxysporum]